MKGRQRTRIRGREGGRDEKGRRETREWRKEREDKSKNGEAGREWREERSTKRRGRRRRRGEVEEIMDGGKRVRKKGGKGYRWQRRGRVGEGVEKEGREKIG